MNHQDYSDKSQPWQIGNRIYKVMSVDLVSGMLANINILDITNPEKPIMITRSGALDWHGDLKVQINNVKVHIALGEWGLGKITPIVARNKQGLKGKR